MRKIINNKIYDTENAEEIADEWNGLGTSDFRNYSETLYKTKKGNFFLYKTGGPMTCMAVSNGNSTSGSSDIEAMSKEDVREWLIDHNEISLVQKMFPDVLEEA